MKKSAVFIFALVIAAVLICAGCVSEQVAKSGDTVSVTYKLTTSSGYTESNSEDDPLTFVIDGGTMISGFNDAVKGMKVGETKTVVIAPEQGYGLRTNDTVMDTLNYTQVNNYFQKTQGRDVVVGDIFDITVRSGYSYQPLSAQILTIDKDKDYVTYSVNQRHAGETLTFEIKLLSINK